MDYNQLLTLMTIIFSCVLLFTSIAELIQKKYPLFFQNLIIYSAYIVFLIAQYTFDIRVRIFIIFLVLITIIGHTLIGQYLDLYHRSITYDRGLHVLGSIAFSLFSYSLLDQLTLHEITSKLYVSIFVTTIGISFGAIFEIVEFVLDAISHSKNQHSLLDTNYDIVANLIGAVIAGLVSVVIFF